MYTKSILLFILSIAAHFAFTQSFSILDSVILANKHVIKVDQENDHFSGEGFDYLQENCDNVQFIGIAENHNTREIPKFTFSLFEKLHEQYSFNYLALEQDPVMMSLLSTREYETLEMAKKHPHGFTFISDQELEMIESTLNLANSKNSVWGCDQSFGASHSIAHILRSFENESDNLKMLESIYHRIYEKEENRNLIEYHYMADTTKRIDFLKIHELIINSGKEELDFYITSLLISDSIFSEFLNKRYYQSRSMRESYMRQRFIAEYKKAMNADPFPKVLLKFGHYHLMDGFNTGSNTLNVGNLIRNLATYNGMESLIISTQIFRDDGSDWDYLDESYPMFTKHASISNWTLFDLRPLRPFDSNGLLKGAVKDEQRVLWEDLLYNYDMILVIGNGGDATWLETGVEY